MKVDYTYTFDESNIQLMKEVYQSNGWTSHNEDNINFIFKASNHVVIAKVDSKLLVSQGHCLMAFIMLPFMM